MKIRPTILQLFFHRFINRVNRISEGPVAPVIAFLLIILWTFTGPFFWFSTTWQLVINTGTTIITFLMVFTIQQWQNKDTMAVQLKLNELIGRQKNASNRLIDVEGLTSDELEVLKKFYIKLSGLSARDNDLHSSHSIDEASAIHTKKRSLVVISKA